MHILKADKVKYCPVIRPDAREGKTLPGVLYMDKLFIKVLSCAKDQGKEAIRYGRQAFLEQKGRVMFLVVEEEAGFTVWKKDGRLKLVENPRKKRDVVGTIKLDQLVEKMRDVGGVTIKDRFYGLKKYPRCFVGRKAVEWFKNYLHISTAEAIGIGQRLVNEKWIHHVCDEHDFEDGYFFYRFYVDE